MSSEVLNRMSEEKTPEIVNMDGAECAPVKWAKSDNVELNSSHANLSSNKSSRTSFLTGYSNLPTSVLVHIFSHFSEEELSSILAPVCRNWQLATRNTSLWKNLKFNSDGVSTNTICRMLRRAPQLESLKLAALADVVSVIRQLCRCNPLLKRLEVKNCTKSYGHDHLSETVMTNLVLSCKQISCLNMEGTQFIPKRFVHDVVRLPHLTSINLSNNQYLRVRDLITLSFNCRSLEELHIGKRRTCEGQLPVTDADAVAIFANLASRLKSVKFDMRDLGSASYEAIFKCSKLENVCLNNVLYLSGDIFRCLDEFLPQLKHLKLNSAAQLTAEDFCHLFSKHRKSMKNLRSLKLFRCWKLNDEALVSIVDTCLENLKYLSVRSCKLLTSASIEYAIKYCPQLQHLDIAHVLTCTDPLHFTHMFDTLSPNMTILIVDYDMQKVGTLKQLKSLMPELKIKYSLSELHKIKSIFVS